MQSANNPQKWEVWWAKVKFEDEPDIVKTRPVVIFDNRQAYIVSFKVTGQMPRENFKGEYVLQKWQEAGLLELNGRFVDLTLAGRFWAVTMSQLLTNYLQKKLKNNS